MMDSWIHEMLRLHAVFVGDEFMGKLALPAALLWTDISGVEAHTSSWSCRHPVVLAGEEQEVDAVPWDAKRAKQAKLWAAVMEKRARAHAQAKAKATLWGCATSVIVWGRFYKHGACVRSGDKGSSQRKLAPCGRSCA